MVLCPLVPLPPSHTQSCCFRAGQEALASHCHLHAVPALLHCALCSACGEGVHLASESSCLAHPGRRKKGLVKEPFPSLQGNPLCNRNEGRNTVRCYISGVYRRLNKICNSFFPSPLSCTASAFRFPLSVPAKNVLSPQSAS